MTNTESNRVTRLAWLALIAILFFIGVTLVGSVMFNPYGLQEEDRLSLGYS